MKKILHHNNGFTLVEILVTLAILSAIMFAMAMTVQTLLKNSGAKKAETIALRQVENAGYWISRDIESADSAVDKIILDGPYFLTINRYYWNDGGEWQPQQVDYVIDEDTGRMTRNIGESSMFISDYIVTDNTTVYPKPSSDNITYYDIQITADYRDVVKTGTYQAEVRRP